MRLLGRITLSMLAGALSFFVTPFLISPFMPAGPFLGWIVVYIIPPIVFVVVFSLLRGEGKR